MPKFESPSAERKKIFIENFRTAAASLCALIRAIEHDDLDPRMDDVERTPSFVKRRVPLINHALNKARKDINDAVDRALGNDSSIIDNSLRLYFRALSSDNRDAEKYLYLVLSAGEDRLKQPETNTLRAELTEYAKIAKSKVTPTERIEYGYYRRTIFDYMDAALGVLTKAPKDKSTAKSAGFAALGAAWRNTRPRVMNG